MPLETGAEADVIQKLRRDGRSHIPLSRCQHGQRRGRRPAQAHSSFRRDPPGRAFLGDVLVKMPGVRETRTYAVLEEVKADDGVLMNLASNEYFAVVQPFLPKKGVTLVSPDFRVRSAKGLQFQSFTAKVARGTMARWLCEERVNDLAALQGFDRDGWAYDPEGSTPARPLFIKV